MKDFGKWFSDFKLPEQNSDVLVAELPAGVKQAADGSYVALCCSCESWKPIYCDINEVPMSGYEHWCGGSPSCCP